MIASRAALQTSRAVPATTLGYNTYFTLANRKKDLTRINYGEENLFKSTSEKIFEVLDRDATRARCNDSRAFARPPAWIARGAPNH
jgi:hypothetical protein